MLNLCDVFVRWTCDEFVDVHLMNLWDELMWYEMNLDELVLNLRDVPSICVWWSGARGGWWRRRQREEPEGGCFFFKNSLVLVEWPRTKVEALSLRISLGWYVGCYSPYRLGLLHTCSTSCSPPLPHFPFYLCASTPTTSTHWSPLGKGVSSSGLAPTPCNL
jgi:hypothetical protein